MTLVAVVVTIWGAVTGFYGTRQWTPIDVCKATYMGDRFALVQARIHGRRHIAALHFYSAGRGWVVMWADGRVNPKIGAAIRPLVLAEMTRLKAKCLAP
ncbi:MAG: hypothetical protein ACM3QU_03055 [Verrucomicrobiota bacterium]